MLLFAYTLLSGCSTSTQQEKPSEDTAQETEQDTAVAVSHCESLGLSELPFSMDAEEARMGNTAADFTLQTTAGPWVFSESWTGCDSYLFFNHHPDYEYPVAVWNSSFDDLLASSPHNTHYFFSSFNQGSEEAEVTALQERFEQAILTLDEGSQEHWRTHVHFVTESIWFAGALGDLLQYRADWAFGINREQQFAEVGSMSMPGSSSWETKMEALAFEAQHHNYRIDLQAEIQSYNSTVITSFDGARVGSGKADLVLPSAEEMQNYDTLHLELELGCGDPYYEDCGEWDYLIYAYLCSESTEENPFSEQECQPHVPETMGLCMHNETVTETECKEDTDCSALETEDGDIVSCYGYTASIAAETQDCACDTPIETTTEATYTCNEEGTGYNDCNCPCNTEIGRWITSYARDGHWTMDASPILAMLKDGGNRKVRFQSSYSYDNTLNFHLSDSGKNGSPKKIIPLFQGGGFNENYNSQYEPMDIEIPAEVQHAELYAVISGHGWGAEVENCAEFCNHTHHFTINGTEFVKEHPQAGMVRGCIDQISAGTTPNQFGTWPYGRGGWCPGMQVDPWIVDVTEQLQAGATTTIGYRGLFNGADYVPTPSNSGQGFGANIKMVSYLVLYW